MDKLKRFNVLLLEDNLSFAKNTIELLDIYFKEIFHSVTIDAALEIFNQNIINVIISDIKVKDGNGLEFITKIREIDLNIPIVILSAHKDEDFLLKAIPLNICSYQLKPIKYENFIDLLYSLSKKSDSVQNIKISDDIEFNPYTKELYENNELINLTKKETLFIDLLLNKKQVIISNEMIQHNIWGDKIMSNSAIKNFILRFRKKVTKNFIMTVQGLGYRILR